MRRGMGVGAGDPDPDLGEHRLRDTLSRSWERTRDGKAGRPNQDGSDGKRHDLGTSEPRHRTRTAARKLVLEMRADLLHHRDHRGTLTLGIDRGKVRSRPQEHGDGGISGRGVVRLDMTREESVSRITIEEEAPHLTPDIAPVRHSVTPWSETSFARFRSARCWRARTAPGRLLRTSATAATDRSPITRSRTTSA
jgi:hypothetical protein